MSTTKVIFNREYGITQMTFDLNHGKKDFNRRAAREIARILVDESCLTTQTAYDVSSGMYQTSITLLVGRQERKLP